MVLSLFEIVHSVLGPRDLSGPFPCFDNLIKRAILYDAFTDQLELRDDKSTYLHQPNCTGVLVCFDD